MKPSLKTAQRAQAKLLAELEADHKNFPESSDGYDYVISARWLDKKLKSLDQASFEKFLTKKSNTKWPKFKTLDNLASDGICNYIYDLDPPALRD